MRRVLAVLSSAAVALGVLVGVASPASAATVSINCEGDSQAVSVAVDETLTITAEHCTIQSTSGVGAFTPSSGYVVSTISFASGVAGQAVLTVYGAGVNPTELTIDVGAGSSGTTEPALVYPTLSLNANEGTCSGTMQFVKYNGQNGTVTLPASDACTREDYTLVGWARSANAPSGDFAAGSTVPIGDESFTLYAVWQANDSFSEITYDSNVGQFDLCWDSEGINVQYARVAPGRPYWNLLAYDRESTVLSSSSERPVSSAPCRPPWGVLTGWNAAPDGSGTSYALTDPIGEVPSTLRLYAQWGLPEVTAGYLAPVTSLNADPFVAMSPGGSLPLKSNPLIPGQSGSLVLLAKDRLGRQAPNVLIPVWAFAPLIVSNVDGLGDSSDLSDASLVWVKTNSTGTGVAEIYTRTTQQSQEPQGRFATWTAGDNQLGFEFLIFGVEKAASPM